MNARQWYRMEASAADPSVVDIHIIDFIGDWVDDFWNRNFGYELSLTAKAFIEQLGKLPDAVKSIRVHINSPGGDVFAALNMANALRDQQVTKGRSVETIVDGLAASAASVVMMAGSKITIADNALVMIHNPWSAIIGSAKDFRKAADELDIIRNTIVSTYKWHSSLEADALVELMDAETWMNADEAIANGLATEKVEGLKAAASIDPRATSRLNVPDKYRTRVEGFVKPAPKAPQAAAATDVLRLCREGECLDIAEGLVAASATLETVQARISETKSTRATAAARAKAITALCATAKLPELAAGYIAGTMNEADVRSHLTTITAKLDKVEIDGGLNPDTGARATSRISVTKVYADMNGLNSSK